MSKTTSLLDTAEADEYTYVLAPLPVPIPLLSDIECQSENHIFQAKCMQDTGNHTLDSTHAV